MDIETMTLDAVYNEGYDRGDADDAWSAFEEGIAEGIRAYIDTVSDYYDDED